MQNLGKKIKEKTQTNKESHLRSLQFSGVGDQYSGQLTLWKRPRCWEKLRAGGEEGGRGWDGWIASLTQWIWVWASSRSWWWSGKPGMLQSMGSQSLTWLSNLTTITIKQASVRSKVRNMEETRAAGSLLWKLWELSPFSWVWHTPNT